MDRLRPNAGRPYPAKFGRFRPDGPRPTKFGPRSAKVDPLAEIWTELRRCRPRPVRCRPTASADVKPTSLHTMSTEHESELDPTSAQHVLQIDHPGSTPEQAQSDPRYRPRSWAAATLWGGPTRWALRSPMGELRRSRGLQRSLIDPGSTPSRPLTDSKAIPHRPTSWAVTCAPRQSVHPPRPVARLLRSLLSQKPCETHPHSRALMPNASQVNLPEQLR